MPGPFHTLDVICARRQALIYVSSPVCEVDFSSSGEPVIVLNPFRRRRGPTGFRLVVINGRIRFNWDATDGAICYSLYRNEGGTYVLVEECFPCEPCADDTGACCFECETCPPGCYAVTVITENGESEPSEEVCVASFPTCEVTITSGSPLPSGAFNAPYSFQLEQEFGLEATEEWSLIAGALPAGLSLSPSGLISGTPTDGGNFTFTANVFAMCDAVSGAENSKEFLLNIAGGPEPTCIYRIADYGTITQPIFTGAPGAPISADPEWDGTFNLSNLDGSAPENYWYKGSNEVYSVPFGVGPNIAVGGRAVTSLSLSGPYPPNVDFTDPYWKIILKYETGFGGEITWIGFRTGGMPITGTYVSGEALLPGQYPPGTFSDSRVVLDIELCP